MADAKLESWQASRNYKYVFVSIYNAYNSKYMYRDIVSCRSIRCSTLLQNKAETQRRTDAFGDIYEKSAKE